MQRDDFVSGEDVPEPDGGMMPLSVFMQKEPETRAFNAYRVAFRANEAHPNLRNAAALVKAWNAFADIMGLAHV
ncbi:hypothetical protein [Pelagibacterium luteolum]|uniref:Uncharacterized protein n=1 Tax=Pelagibacterium luteolum TaxID=440168 RepID=A0A1G7ZJ36_9HYPH|nr:hypothetical protein [Pelagibacterium luteolum]SDH08110.1 hypothetical protein SAMN04487974_12019 [Pelagibacterium luteolum]